MCTRYSLNLADLDLSFLGLKGRRALKPVRHVVPGHQVWLVRHTLAGQPELVQAKWGLVPDWLTDLSKAQVNARAETAASRPMFRQAWEQQRCLILADSYYLWQMESTKRRRLWQIRPSSGGLMMFAGLWERYTVDDRLSFDSCAVVTMPAVPCLQLIAERMPAVIPRGAARDWLSCQAFDLDRLSDQLDAVPFYCTNALEAGDGLKYSRPI